ncbi:hypothetical protein AWH56_004295 [Anaerobacillus isosaccharinicus]|uniref:Uncharacterized protein n=1 Tax=Anaerobacillus isosaccharinicus TaxID=1532552 RepID=A0A1S2L391_9BACI|nr:hypothetical protein [Anaerobacillus isosaccharinicus]MBA5584753.1 hypothetical protein [Anaerobacillus isosaccharinicus]QOY36879.1 hypothetical protein AWH56_004295 [Anaerobacillus isosaccharinicus]
MKKTDWLIALSFIVIGLSCLAMAILFSLSHYSTLIFFGILFQICLWFIIPLLILIFIWIILKFPNKK